MLLDQLWSECISFLGKERRINIPEEIGVKYRDFGLLFLEDHNGARIRAVGHKHNNDEKEINIEVIEEWVAGKGIHHVNWKILTEVLHDIELSTLAEEIEAKKVNKGFIHCVHNFTAIYLVVLLHCRHYCLSILMPCNMLVTLFFCIYMYIFITRFSSYPFHFSFYFVTVCWNSKLHS